MCSISECVTVTRELAGEDLGGLSDAALLDRMRHLQEMRCLVDAAAVATAGAVHRRGAVSHDGSASTKSWIQGRLRLAPGEAGTLVDTAAAMPELPRFAGALGAGEITLGHAAVAAWLARKVGRAAPELVPQAEELLFPHTQRLNSSELRHVAKRIAAYLVPERDDPPDPERALFLAQTYGGIWDLKGCLSPEFGAMLQTILTTLPKPDPDDERSAAERRHDALAELVRRILDSRELPANGGEQPHLAVLVHANDLRTTATGRCVLAEDPAPDGEGDDRNGGWNDHRASGDGWDADPNWSADADWGAASGADPGCDADIGCDADVGWDSAEVWDWETLADWRLDPQPEPAVAALGAAATNADRPETGTSGVLVPSGGRTGIGLISAEISTSATGADGSAARPNGPARGGGSSSGRAGGPASGDGPSGGRASGPASGDGASGVRTGRGPGDAAAPGSGPSGFGYVPGSRWV
ncbi:DUF222 domain-containing protein, partial [Cryptosporangium minutisporangium]